MRAKAATLISSNQTNRLNKSLVRQKPTIAASKEQHQHVEMCVLGIEIAPLEVPRSGLKEEGAGGRKPRPDFMPTIDASDQNAIGWTP